MKQQLKRHILLTVFALLQCLSATKAQVNEVYLNQGEISNDAILVESKRILINTAPYLSFWDIDRGLLLKSFANGNQFTSGLTQSQLPLNVSPKGNYLVCSTVDSLIVYSVATQRSVKAIPLKRELMQKIYVNFTLDEGVFVLVDAKADGPYDLQAWQTDDWQSLDLYQLNKQFHPDPGSCFVAGNNFYSRQPTADAKLAVISFERGTPPVIRSVTLPVPQAYLANSKFLPGKDAGELIAYGADPVSKTTWTGVYDLKNQALIKQWTLNVQAERCFADIEHGWLVFTANEFLVPEPEKGFPLQVLNIDSGSSYAVRLPDIIKNNSGYYTLSFEDYMIKNGHFLMRSSVSNKINGVNLATQKTFSIDGYLQLNYLIIHDNRLYYRTQKDRSKGEYKVIQTEVPAVHPIAVKGTLLNLSPLSQVQSISLIHKEEPGRYVFENIEKGKDQFVARKLIRLQNYPVSPLPVGFSGGKYLFRYEFGNSNLAETEFNELPVGSVAGQLFEGRQIKYLEYDLGMGTTNLSAQNYNFENNYKGNGYFSDQYKTSSFGFLLLDSLKLTVNNNVIAASGPATADSLFGYRAASLSKYATNLQVNTGQSMAVFNLNQELVAAGLARGRFTSVAVQDISVLNKSYASISQVGFCSKGDSIYCVYTSGNDLGLFTFSRQLKPGTNYRRPAAMCSIEVSAASNAFLINNETNKQTELHFTGKNFQKVYPWKNKKWLFNSSEAKFSPSGNTFYIYEHTGNLTFYQTAGGQYIGSDSLKNIKPVALIADRYFTYLDPLGVPCQLDIKQKTRQTFSHPNYTGATISQVQLNKGDSILVTAGLNRIYLWNLNTRQLHRTLLLIDSNNVFALNTAGFYTTGKANLNDILSRSGIVVSPIQSLDLFYNRPSQFINANSQQAMHLKQALEMAYEKRLRYNGFKGPVSLKSFITNSVNCQVTNAAALSSFPAQNQLTLNVRLKSATSPLKNLHILINGVPVYGKNGLPLKPALQADTALSLQLSYGQNQLSVYATNAEGQSSNIFPLQIDATTQPVVAGKLYFIGIGIDQFAQPEHNLNWSVKDVLDLSARLREKYGGNSVVTTLFNQDVTPVKIAALKDQLSATGINDKVIVAYSGHGLLNSSFDYYLSTYGVDFDKPERGGLAYTQLEDLLDGIPARQKLLLIDACHSGEVDKEEAQQYVLLKDSLAKKGTKGGDVINTDSARLGMKNSFELMQDVFANLGRSTGTTVIAAAGGTQYAFEKSDLKNGVFTYAILEYLQQQPHATISALKQQIKKRVTEITLGLQMPTTRSETPLTDWYVW